MRYLRPFLRRSRLPSLPDPMTESIQFSHPQVLWLLAPPFLLLLWKGAVAAPPNCGCLPRLMLSAPEASALMGGWIELLPVLLALALRIALARPRLGRGSTDIESSGIDIMLTVDVSGSMEAMDFTLNGQPSNRLEVVKDVVAKFTQQRANDKIGLVAFAGRPYLVSPLTQDRNWLGQRIGSLKMGLVEDGTAIGSALVSAVSHLKDSKAKSRIIILLTDGVNNKGSRQSRNQCRGRQSARHQGLHHRSRHERRSSHARARSLAASRYRRVKVEIDEPMLTKVAELTGGKMFRATDTSSLEKIYELINQLETTTRKLKKYENYEELYLYALLPGLAIFIVSRLLGQTLFRTLP